jgi:hypothetical protein
MMDFLLQPSQTQNPQQQNVHICIISSQLFPYYRYYYVLSLPKSSKLKVIASLLESFYFTPSVHVVHNLVSPPLPVPWVPLLIKIKRQQVRFLFFWLRSMAATLSLQYKKRPPVHKPIVPTEIPVSNASYAPRCSNQGCESALQGGESLRKRRFQSCVSKKSNTPAPQKRDLLHTILSIQRSN